ncbi:MAG: hypothetical protein HY092_00305 [Candidatus Kerfeldbacteria bacterium]|nr:hypothetical protein [Candidatus Kerfeldbacteria bacterium]
MPLVFAGIVPHSPLLVPGVAKEHYPLFSQTIKSVAVMSAELYATQPDAVVILSPHMTSVPDHVTVQVGDRLEGNLTEFGDPSTTVSLWGATGLAHLLKAMAEQQKLMLEVQTPTAIDYSVTISAMLLGLSTHSVQCLPIGVAHVGAAALLRVGLLLNEWCHQRPERMAIIATADLTRRHDSNTAERRPTKEEREISLAVTAVDPAPLGAYVGKSKTCGIQPITTLLACLQPHRSKGTIRSFEAPLGVGQMVADVSLGA